MHGKQAHRKPTLLPLDKETWFHFGTMSYSSLEIQNRYYCTSSVYYEHLKSHPELKEAFERGKFEADAIVHASLLKSATGYSYKKKKHFAHQGIVTSDVMETVHVSPSVPAQIFHITNKRTDWRHGDGQVKSDQKAAILEALEGLTQENESN